jgi:hypothetical protein
VARSHGRGWSRFLPCIFGTNESDVRQRPSQGQCGLPGCRARKGRSIATADQNNDNDMTDGMERTKLSPLPAAIMNGTINALRRMSMKKMDTRVKGYTRCIDLKIIGCHGIRPGKVISKSNFIMDRLLLTPLHFVGPM